MNTKLSGAQLVLVPITKMGENKFPWVENIRSRFIKFVDFFPTRYLPGTTAEGLEVTDGLFVTFKNAAGNTEFIRNLPLQRLDYQKTLGIRQPIFSNIALSDCSVNCQNESVLGKVAAFVFWYDLPDFSAKNNTTKLVTDSISIPLTTKHGLNVFPDLERMSGKRFRRMLLSNPNFTPDGNPGIGGDQAVNIYLTLRKGSYNVVENLPIKLLWQLYMLEKSEFQNIIFDFQSSYLIIGGDGSIPNIDEYIGKSVFFNLQYEKQEG